MPKLLVEFLHEQQEPFALEPYLVERGYSISSCLIKRPRKIRRRDLLVGKCSRFLKAIIVRRNIINNHKNILENGYSGGFAHQEADLEDMSSASATTSLFFNSSDVEDEHMKWRSTHEDIGNKKLSSDEDQCSPFHDMKGESASISTISECSKSTTHHININVAEEVDNWQFMINKRVLQQKKQLLIDCVREVIENININQRRSRDDEEKILMGAEELWKIVCENVWVWSQDEVPNIVDDQIFMAASSQIHKDQISIEIGDAIFQDIIIHELQTIIT